MDLEGQATLSTARILFSIDFFLQSHGLWFMISGTIQEPREKFRKLPAIAR